MFKIQLRKENSAEMIQIDRRGSFKNFLNNVPLMISFCAYVCLTVTSIGKVVFALAGGVVLLFASFHIEMKMQLPIAIAQ